MKLLAIHLTNVRKFTGKRASITGIGNGITVVSAANEFGKSTFFDALHALFFEKYSSSAKPVKSLQPYAGGAVEVAAEIETDQGKFRVEKRFLLRKMAKITRLSDAVIVAQDDEAERWVSTLLGSAHDGPAGLLWVRQGMIGLEPDSTSEKKQLTETRRDLLSSVAGEIDAMTGGRRMDRIMQRVAENLKEIATKTGRKTGAWKAASDEAEQLESDLGNVTEQVKTLDAALTERKQSEESLKRFDDPAVKKRRNTALSQAQSAMENTRTHGRKVDTARQKRDLASLQAHNAKSNLDALLAAISALQEAKVKVLNSATKAKIAKREADLLKATAKKAGVQHETMLGAVTKSRQRLDTTRRQIDARKTRAEATRLQGQITKAETAIKEREAAFAKQKASNATPDWLRSAEEAEATVIKLDIVVQAQTTTLSMAYQGTKRIHYNGAPVPDDQPVTLEEDACFDLPGIGKMTIHTHLADGKDAAKLAEAKALRNRILAKVGVMTIQDARTNAASRAENRTAVDLAQAVLDTLAPNGIEVLHTAKAQADLAAAGADDTPLPAIADLETNLTLTKDAENQARQSLSGANADYTVAQEEAIKAQVNAELSQQALGRAHSDAGPEDKHEVTQANHLETRAQTSADLIEAEKALDAVTADAPDLETTKAELQRAENAESTATKQRAQEAERLAALSSEIRTSAGNGIEERRDNLAGQLDTARAVETQLARQAAALARLQDALSTERNASRETYFGPIQEELKPLLSILHRDATLSFDSESMLPIGLRREQSQENFDDLSGGTKEQIAILTRLAFARLFSRQGRHMPIVLDDALIYSDDDRIIKMFTALTRVAQDQQILVFSCRQLAFQDLGGARPTVEVTDI